MYNISIQDVESVYTSGVPTKQNFSSNANESTNMSKVFKCKKLDNQSPVLFYYFLTPLYTHILGSHNRLHQTLKKRTCQTSL